MGGQEQVDIYDSGARITKLLVVHWTLQSCIEQRKVYLNQDEYVGGITFKILHLNFKLKQGRFYGPFKLGMIMIMYVIYPPTRTR